MHTVAMEPANLKIFPRQIIMTQYMLKLLTILSNILVTNLNEINQKQSSEFVLALISAIKGTQCGDIQLNAAD